MLRGSARLVCVKAPVSLCIQGPTVCLCGCAQVAPSTSQAGYWKTGNITRDNVKLKIPYYAKILFSFCFFSVNALAWFLLVAAGHNFLLFREAKKNRNLDLNGIFASNKVPFYAKLTLAVFSSSNVSLVCQRTPQK